MANYSIWVLEYAYVPNYHVSGIIYGYHNQGYRKLPYCYVLIKGKHHAAMVDVGYNHKEFGGYLGDKFGVINWHSPSEVLKECSLRPEDIDTVFVTHAHFDHFGNVDDFPKAKFYIQEREIAKWVWAMSLPERTQWMMVAIDPGDVLRGVELAKNKRLVTVNGDLVNVLPGIDLHPAYDSHTFGSMWVEVRNDGKSTSQDTWVLAGDLIYVYENLSGSGDLVGVEKIYNPERERKISVPSKVAVKIRLAVVQKFTAWYHPKGTLKKPTIALMQEPDSDTYVSNSGLNRSRA